MAIDVPVLWRLFLFAARVYLNHEMRVLYDRLTADPTERGIVLFEGLFNLVKASMVFTRVGEDVAVIGMHFAPIRAGLIADTPATHEEMDKIAARLATLYGALKGFHPPEFAYDRLIFHDAGPKITGADGKTIHVPGEPKGSWNPALRTDIIVSGEGTSETVKQLPFQVALSVTQKTVSRRQWGRVYWPSGDANMIADSASHAGGAGQFDSDTVGAVRNAFGDLLDGANSDNTPLVVWSHVHQHALSVDTVQVDSLPDVIRRRREDRAALKLSHTLGA